MLPSFIFVRCEGGCLRWQLRLPRRNHRPSQTLSSPKVLHGYWELSNAKHCDPEAPIWTP